MKTICIDLTNIIPGIGGVGGGIATYGKSLATGLDELFTNEPSLNSKYKILILLNLRNSHSFNFKNIKSFYFRVNNQNIIKRMVWLNLRLPKFLVKAKVSLLHRVVSELPSIKVCKTVVTIHDFMFDFYLNNPDFFKYLKFKEKLKFHILNKLLYRSLIQGDNLLITSLSVKNEILQKVSVDSSKIKLAPLAYERSVSQSDYPTINGDAKKEKIFFGVVAAFHPHKGHLHVLRLAKKMIDNGFGDQIHFLFRGSPVYKNYHLEVQDLIWSLNLFDHVTFEPFEPNLTLDDIYKKYSVTILLSECEGFGLPVIEAQAFQKPVICSDLPVFREILGDSAIFISNSPSNEEVKLLFQKLNDERYLTEIISKGNLNANRFNWKLTCEKVFTCYMDVLGDDR